MPNLLIYSPGADTGGLGIAMKRAFDKHAPEWTARHIRREDNYLHYPADIEGIRPRHATPQRSDAPIPTRSTLSRFAALQARHSVW